MDGVHDGCRLVLGDLLALDAIVQGPAYVLKSSLDEPFLDVPERDLEARLGGSLGDAGPHGACSQDADLLDIARPHDHRSLPVVGTVSWLGGDNKVTFHGQIWALDYPSKERIKNLIPLSIE